MVRTQIHFSFTNGWLYRFVIVGIFLSLGFIQGCASYTDEDVVLSPRVKMLLEEFPAGTIDTVEKADEVMEAVSYENQMLKYQYGQDMDACAKKFLVTKCYEETQFNYKKNRSALKPLSIEADRFKRSEKVRLRDQALADAQQEELSKASEREKSRRAYEEKEARYIQETKEVENQNSDQHYVDLKVPEEAMPPKVEDGVYTVSNASQLKNPDTVLTADERAKNVREFKEKQLISEKKQEAVERRKAETQAKRNRRIARQKEGIKKKEKVAKD